jgi:hypothetical protein
MVCPICNLASIAPSKNRCPQCDADLTPFKVLDSLPDEPIRERTGRGGQVGLMAAIGVFLVLAVAISVLQLYGFRRIESLLSGQQTGLMDFMTTVHSAVEQLARDQSRLVRAAADWSEAAIAIKERIQAISVDEKMGNRSRALGKGRQGGLGMVAHGALRIVASRNAQERERYPDKPPDASSSENDPSANARFWTYAAGRRDTLWGIAQRYYRSGYYYPVLLEHNPHLEIYDIGDGVPIRLLKDPDLADEIYRSITERRGSDIYWTYTVAEGDTLRSIAKRFFNSEDMVARITDSNPGIEIKRGARIKILLE